MVQPEHEAVSVKVYDPGRGDVGKRQKMRAVGVTTGPFVKALKHQYS